ncbi:MAG: sensor histidine kinase, partial [Bacteroidota bacterium]
FLRYFIFRTLLVCYPDLCFSLNNYAYLVSMNPNRKKLQIVIHVAIWTGFLLLPFINFSGQEEMLFKPGRTLQLLFFTINLFLVGFYYLHSLVLIRRLLAERKIARYIISILALLAFFIFIPNIYFQFVQTPTLSFPATMQPPVNSLTDRFGGRRVLPFAFPGTIVMFLLILIVSGGIKIINQWFRSERRTEEIEKEKIVTELALLRLQVNPHFLFNTLNNIYSQAVTGSPDTAASVMKLSTIMRYVLEDVKNNLVPLTREIQFLENYISLQHVRLTEKSVINFKKNGKTEGKEIAPLLLIAFVENAFKYGISSHQTSVIEIQLEVTGNHLIFIVTNQKFDINPAIAANTGIGLTNTKRRLDLMYCNRHSLTVESEAGSFLTTLTLDLLC